MRHLIDTFLEPALWFAADWSLRWAALLAVVALILWIFRPRRAAMRQLFLLTTLIAGLLVPVAPHWGGGWEHVHQLPEPSPPSSFPGSAWEREDPLGGRRLLVLAFASCWSLAVAYLLIRSLCGWIYLRSLRRQSVATTGATTDLFAACCAKMCVQSLVRLATHPYVRSPILFGWLRPCILVPPDWPQPSTASQRAGLLHELAHVRRRDHLLAPLLEIVRIAFFFHPLVRRLLGRLEQERELLCDEMVVRLGIDRREYAHVLLEFARSSGRLDWPSVSLPMSRRRTVKGRIHHLLCTFRENRRGFGR